MFIELNASGEWMHSEANFQILCAAIAAILSLWERKICRVFHTEQHFHVLFTLSLARSLLISLFYLHFHNTRFSAHTAEGKKTAIFRILWKRKPEKYFPNDCFSRRLCLHHARRIFPHERVNRQKNKEFKRIIEEEKLEKN